MRNRLFYIILVIAMPLNAQMVSLPDTFLIGEVVISARHDSPGMPGLKSILINPALMSNYYSSTLGEMLSAITPLSIKSYGAGGISTPSFRGTGASHTLITWNGIDITNPMPGQYDLSLITPGIAEEIRVNSGSASMITGSGGFGGGINIGNIPDWGKKTQISLMPGTGSFGNYTGMVKIKSGSDNFTSSTKAYFQSSENNFSFINDFSSSIPVKEIRKNGQLSQKGMSQEIYYRWGKSSVSARVWYHQASRNLSQPVISQQIISGEKQVDESLRSMIDFSHKFRWSDLLVTAAWIKTRLDYTNRLASIVSENLSDAIILKGGWTKRIDKLTTLSIRLDNQLNSVVSNNYGDHILRNISTVTVTAERETSSKIGTMILVREIMDNKTLLLPDFCAGLEFRLTNGDDYVIYTNFSRNSRIPTLNDLHWSPGGNPDLKNEYALSGELGYRMSPRLTSELSVVADVSFYSNFIRDMIVWRPGEFSYWIADNVKSVNASGADISVEAGFQSGGLNFTFNTGYSFTRSVAAGNDAESLSGKQLIYIPVNQINNTMNVIYRNVYTMFISDFTGKRFISADNSEYLPGYLLNDLVTGIKFDIGKILLDVNFRIGNLFNVRYETMAYYPQPGRSYFLNLKFHFNN